MPAGSMFERFDRDGARTLRLRGEVDLAARDEFRTQMASLVDGAHSPVCIDLSEVTFIDSSALGVLVVMREQAAERGVDVVLRAPSPPVSRVLSITALDHVFTIDAGS